MKQHNPFGAKLNHRCFRILKCYACPDIRLGKVSSAHPIGGHGFTCILCVDLHIHLTYTGVIQTDIDSHDTYAVTTHAANFLIEKINNQFTLSKVHKLDVELYENF